MQIRSVFFFKLAITFINSVGFCNLAAVKRSNKFRLIRCNSFVGRPKNLPAVQETWVKSLGWEDLLEKGMAIHSSILA